MGPPRLPVDGPPLPGSPGLNRSARDGRDGVPGGPGDRGERSPACVAGGSGQAPGRRACGSGGEEQLTDELIGVVVGSVRPARPAGHGSSWEALAAREGEITAWVRRDLTLVKIGELLERSGTAVPYRTLARFAAAECGFSSGRPGVTVRVDDPPPGRELQGDFGYLGMIPDGERRRKLHALVFTAVFSRYCFVWLTFSQTTLAVIAGCEAAWQFFGGVFPVLIRENLKPVVDAAG